MKLKKGLTVEQKWHALRRKPKESYSGVSEDRGERDERERSPNDERNRNKGEGLKSGDYRFYLVGENC